MNLGILLLDSSKMFSILFQKELETIYKKRSFRYLHASTLEEALSFLKDGNLCLIVSELHLKEKNHAGMELLKKVRSNHNLRWIPFVIVSMEKNSSTIKEAYINGANEYLSKPLDPLDYYKFINMLDNFDHNVKVNKKMMDLSTGMDDAVQVVKEREREIILRLAKAAATRDKETGNHIYRVGQYSLILAKTLGLSFHMQEIIEKASPLHDVGKIAIPDYILQKPGKLTDEEYKIMKNHTIYGYKVLYNPNMELLKIAADIALSHHENWDGKGYPYGKKGEEIPLASRVTTVADVFDALVSKRRYKAAFSLSETLKAMKNESGTSFDPDVVDALFESKQLIFEVYEALKDEE